jgi:diguanylate cyclase (GGDEF)-like protein
MLAAWVRVVHFLIVPMRYSGAQRSLWYAAAGAILSVGAPTGLLIMRELYAPRPLAAELSSERLTYLYVLISTTIVLAFLGFILGRQADRLARLSETDPLTGLPNRRALRRHLEEEFRRSKRYRTPVSLLLIDIDGLKQVNDADGHAAGDRLIRVVAASIVDGLRESDFGARWGGDEFAILEPNTPAHAAHASAERLVARVATQRDSHLRRRPTVSIGVATYDPTRDARANLEDIVRAADDALYRAKAGGRNRVDAA